MFYKSCFSKQEIWECKIDLNLDRWIKKPDFSEKDAYWRLFITLPIENESREVLLIFVPRNLKC